MASSFTEARRRQLARLNGAKSPTPRAAIALAKSQAYQDAADAPATLRAYATDLANYKAWCDRHRFVAMPATPAVVGAYLAAAGEGYAMPTLRRRVAAIARACGVAGHPLDTRHPAIRETLRGIGRKHGSPSRRAAAITTAEVRKLCRACGPDLTGARDQAMFLLGFAGALRRSELVGLDVEHVTWTGDGLKLLIERSKTDTQGEGAEIAIPPGSGRRHLPSDRPQNLVGTLRNYRRPAVPQGQPWWLGRTRQADRGRSAPDPSEACCQGRTERHAGRTVQPARPACWVHHNCLPQWCAGRRNHGSYPASESGHDAELHSTGQAQSRESGWQIGTLGRRPPSTTHVRAKEEVTHSPSHPIRQPSLRQVIWPIVDQVASLA